MAGEQRAADAITRKVEAVEHGRRLREQYDEPQRQQRMEPGTRIDLHGEAVLVTRAGKFRLTATERGIRVSVIEGYLRHHERLVIAHADHGSVTFEMSP